MTDIDVELLEGEQLMSDSDELAYRQVAPHMLEDDGKIATTAFGPNSSDNNKPSFSRQREVSPQAARDWHDEYANSPSRGVWAVSVGEVVASGRYVVDDSKCALDPGALRAPGHCFVDFRGLSKLQRKELRAMLHMHAMRRGEIPTEAAKEDGQLFS
ncbi:hypothetical protein [Salinibacterium sp. SWN167]|uniref:hypothetical protein n=1 Tax=Salinibacterium sp. SWN167 TaxID=2792054 RepID=UPI0018CEA5CC|nr:hypothetical protein [Salinibacterium sp. SWN167]MBH0083313.1 hypothetical protein [Salinibacterium sp. SWN167]